MAILIPRKKDYWQRKPSVGQEVDWGNSLTDGLIGYWLNDGSHQSNIVTSDAVTLNGTATYGESGGESVALFDASTGCYIESPKIASLDGSNGMTVLTTAKLGVRDVYSGIMTQFTSSQNGWSLQMNNAANTLLIAVRNGSDAHYSGGSPTLSTTDYKTLGFIYDGTGATDRDKVRPFLDGKEVTDMPIAAAGFPTALGTNTADIRFGNTAIDTGLFYGGEIGVSALWGQAVQAEDYTALQENPYQILKPRRKYWVLPTAAAPTGFQAAWAMAANNLIGAGFN